jgi:hypothetical protein
MNILMILKVAFHEHLMNRDKAHIAGSALDPSEAKTKRTPIVNGKGIVTLAAVP